MKNLVLYFKTLDIKKNLMYNYYMIENFFEKFHEILILNDYKKYCDQ